MMSKLKKLLFVSSGFFVGQGAMFIVQTYLVLNDEVSLIGEVVTYLGLLSLYQWVTDCGGVYLLSKNIKEKGFELLSSYILSRLFFVFLLLLLSLPFVYYFELIDKSQGVVLWILPICLISAFNLFGALDYYEKNKIAGLFSGLSWLFSAVSLMLIYIYSLPIMYCGLFFTVGLLATVLIHWLVLKSELCKSNFNAANYRNVRQFFVDGVLYNLSFASSQMLGRLVPIILIESYGKDLAGIYLYGKSLMNMASQMLMFFRRVEFKGLLSVRGYPSVSKIIESQRFSLIAITVFSSLVLLVGFYYKFFVGGESLLYFEVLMWSSLVLLSFSISSSLNQYFIAINKVGFSSTVNSVSAVICLLVIYFVVPISGFVYVFLFEILMNVVRFMAMVFLLKKIG